jgi:hypothetical protein
MSSLVRALEQRLRGIEAALAGLPVTIYRQTVTLDFPNTAPAAINALTATVPGAVTGDAVIVGTTSAEPANGGLFYAKVTNTDEVTVYFTPLGGVAINPASATFNIIVFHF